ncbi:helix-turn-helix domain-containing protein [Amycolatopsis cihanbeyliensis]|uniref:Helix-turn-helix protein n=1 Tax=Amycolatopsis cihanbeyliensis TaxID=1128664 RepID=A0A542DIS1_AMYCI|nr:helix-turn-helix transcriptional regulator [Amycolatopsis cihanbeyliensis]TQJ02999.1 helix-turn-helix protein [Amycolatopsis cihanbeyliensis]
MARRKGISIRQRRVSAQLRALRTARRLSCKDIAAALGWSESKVSRMETGERGLYADDVAAILGYLQTPAAIRNELLELVRDGQERNWHEIHGKLPTNWRDLIRFENEATAIHNYESLVIPGIAQTPEYSRTVIHGANPRLTGNEVETLVAARATRQVILGRRPAPSVHLILDEMVLQRPVGEPELRRTQLHHLLSLGERRNVTVQVVPFTAGAHPGLEGPFVLLEFVNEPTLVYAENRRASSFLEEEEHVERVRVAWRGLDAVALSPEDSARLIANVAGELNQPEEPPS